MFTVDPIRGTIIIETNQVDTNQEVGGDAGRGRKEANPNLKQVQLINKQVIKRPDAYIEPRKSSSGQAPAHVARLKSIQSNIKITNQISRLQSHEKQTVDRENKEQEEETKEKGGSKSEASTRIGARVDNQINTCNYPTESILVLANRDRFDAKRMISLGRPSSPPGPGPGKPLGANKKFEPPDKRATGKPEKSCCILIINILIMIANAVCRPLMRSSLNQYLLRSISINMNYCCYHRDCKKDQSTISTRGKKLFHNHHPKSPSISLQILFIHLLSSLVCLNLGGHGLIAKLALVNYATASSMTPSFINHHHPARTLTLTTTTTTPSNHSSQIPNLLNAVNHHYEQQLISDQNLISSERIRARIQTRAAPATTPSSPAGSSEPSVDYDGYITRFDTDEDPYNDAVPRYIDPMGNSPGPASSSNNNGHKKEANAAAGGPGASPLLDNDQQNSFINSGGPRSNNNNNMSPNPRGRSQQQQHQHQTASNILPKSSHSSSYDNSTATATNYDDSDSKQISDDYLDKGQEKSDFSYKNATNFSSSEEEGEYSFLGSIFKHIDKQWQFAEVILIIVISVILNLVTIIGNIMVLISFKMDRSLQTVSNYFLLSLALADLLIGLISMPLYTLYLLLNYWPLGALMCDIWLAIDYLNSNAAVLNMLIISFDRYFSVTRPLTYRAKRTTKHACLMISCAWILSLTIWTPAIFTYPYYRGRTVQGTNKCEIEFVKANSYLTFVTAILAFYIPVAIMIYLYWRIWLETKKRYRDLTTLFLVSGVGAAGPANRPNRQQVTKKQHQQRHKQTPMMTHRPVTQGSSHQNPSSGLMARSPPPPPLVRSAGGQPMNHLMAAPSSSSSSSNNKQLASPTTTTTRAAQLNHQKAFSKNRSTNKSGSDERSFSSSASPQAIDPTSINASQNQDGHRGEIQSKVPLTDASNHNNSDNNIDGCDSNSTRNECKKQQQSADKNGGRYEASESNANIDTVNRPIHASSKGKCVSKDALRQHCQFAGCYAARTSRDSCQRRHADINGTSLRRCRYSKCCPYRMANHTSSKNVANCSLCTRRQPQKGCEICNSIEASNQRERNFKLEDLSSEATNQDLKLLNGQAKQGPQTMQHKNSLSELTGTISSLIGSNRTSKSLAGLHQVHPSSPDHAQEDNSGLGGHQQINAGALSLSWDPLPGSPGDFRKGKVVSEEEQNNSKSIKDKMIIKKRVDLEEVTDTSRTDLTCNAQTIESPSDRDYETRIVAANDKFCFESNDPNLKTELPSSNMVIVKHNSHSRKTSVRRNCRAANGSSAIDCKYCLKLSNHHRVQCNYNSDKNSGHLQGEDSNKHQSSARRCRNCGHGCVYTKCFQSNSASPQLHSKKLDCHSHRHNQHHHHHHHHNHHSHSHNHHHHHQHRQQKITDAGSTAKNHQSVQVMPVNCATIHQSIQLNEVDQLGKKKHPSDNDAIPILKSLKLDQDHRLHSTTSETFNPVRMEQNSIPSSGIWHSSTNFQPKTEGCGLIDRIENKGQAGDYRDNNVIAKKARKFNQKLTFNDILFERNISIRRNSKIKLCDNNKRQQHKNNINHNNSAVENGSRRPVSDIGDLQDNHGDLNRTQHGSSAANNNNNNISNQFGFGVFSFSGLGSKLKSPTINKQVGDTHSTALSSIDSKSRLSNGKLNNNDDTTYSSGQNQQGDIECRSSEAGRQEGPRLEAVKISEKSLSRLENRTENDCGSRETRDGLDCRKSSSNSANTGSEKSDAQQLRWFGCFRSSSRHEQDPMSDYYEDDSSHPRPSSDPRCSSRNGPFTMFINNLYSSMIMKLCAHSTNCNNNNNNNDHDKFFQTNNSDNDNNNIVKQSLTTDCKRALNMRNHNNHDSDVEGAVGCGAESDRDFNGNDSDIDNKQHNQQNHYCKSRNVSSNSTITKPPQSHHPIQPKSERKAAKTLSTLLLVFIVTWLPYNVLVLIKTLSGGEDQVPEKIWNFSYYLCYINSTINPLCYALCNAQFRRTYMRILKCKLSNDHQASTRRLVPTIQSSSTWSKDPRLRPSESSYTAGQQSTNSNQSGSSEVNNGFNHANSQSNKYRHKIRGT